MPLGATLGQLAQSFDSGILRGEEYNSMMENGSAAMRIFADQTGKTLGQLKSLADQGAIAADHEHEPANIPNAILEAQLHAITPVLRAWQANVHPEKT